MKDNMNINLDELIDFVLTDKYLEFSPDEVENLSILMRDKLNEIVDPDEKFFYEGVVDGLFIELDKINNKESSKDEPNNLSVIYKERIDEIHSKIDYKISIMSNSAVLTKIPGMKFGSSSCYGAKYQHFPRSWHRISMHTFFNTIKSISESRPESDKMCSNGVYFHFMDYYSSVMNSIKFLPNEVGVIEGKFIKPSSIIEAMSKLDD